MCSMAAHVRQTRRILNEGRLLRGAPFTKCVCMCKSRVLIDACSAMVATQARLDIPPLYRARIWAVLLDVSAEHVALFGSINTATPTATDHQISVRCACRRAALHGGRWTSRAATSTTHC